jgi:hypothetical protein
MYLKGQQVVCVDDKFDAWARAIYDNLPKLNEVYIIRDVGVGMKVTGVIKDAKNPLSFSGEHDVVVWLEELSNKSHPTSNEEYGFLGTRFAPLKPLTEEQIESIVIGLEREQQEEIMVECPIEESTFQ